MKYCYGLKSNGGTESYTYDSMGRILSVTDPTGAESSQTYDVMGNVTSITYPEGGGISYAYDEYSRISSETLSIGTIISYSYNYEGLLKQLKNGRGQETTYAYDELGRITSFTDELGTVSYTYDGNGNILKTTETTKDGKVSTITRTYDCMDRVTSLTDYQGRTIRYSYDELGNLIGLEYAGGEIIRYSYTDAGLLDTVTDGEGRKTSYTYDKSGHLLTTTKPDGSVETNTYDDQGRLAEKRVEAAAHGANELLYSYSYTYDEWGNITSIRSERGAAYGEASTETILSESMADTGSLNSATMTYDEANRMVSYNGVKVTYDSDGNMTYGPLNGEMVEFEYDCRNRLIRAGDTYYSYDAENNRVAVETPDYIEEYIVDSSQSLSRVLEVKRTYKEEKVSENEVYYYGNGLIYEKTENSDILVYHYDHLGSTVAITDEAGKLILAFGYGTYGELIDKTEYGTTASDDIIIRFLYNGKLGVSTDENGLYYMRSRYYNPQIKRFINQDILTGNIVNNASLNRYSYVEGNPVSYTDPFGLSPFMEGLHLGLDLLGIIPGFDFCDGINAAIYFAEGRWKDCIKSLVYMAPGMDFMGKAQRYAVKGGKLGKQAITVAEYATYAGKISAALMSAEDLGNTVGGMIDKYLVNGEKVTADIALEFLSIVVHGTQNLHYTGSVFKLKNLDTASVDTVINASKVARQEVAKVNSYDAGTTIQYSSLTGNSPTIRMDLQLFANKGGKKASISKTESPALKNSPYNPDVVNQRIKPDYVPNPAHDASSNLYNPKKTPEPNDAREVYNNAVRGGMGEWYGVNGSGEIYQFFYDRNAGAHFAGIISKQDLARKNSSLIELLGISMKGKR